MQINQPTENPNIPSELAQQITAVRNQVSLGEGELRRLTELVVSQKYEVNQLVKQKIDLEDQIKALTENKTLIEGELEDLKNQTQKTVDQKLEIDDIIAKNTTIFNARQSELIALEEQTKKARSAVESEKKVLEASKDAHFKEKEAFQARVKKLNEALK